MRMFRIVTVLLVCGSSMACKANDWNSAEIFDHQGVVELADAACDGRASDIERLLAGGVNPNYAGKADVTPLLFAMQCKNVDGFKAIVEGGANVDQLSYEKYNPAILAAQQEDPSYIKILIAHGADLYAVPPKAPQNAIGTAFVFGAISDNWLPYEAVLSSGIDVNRFVDGDKYEDLAILTRTYARYDRLLQILDKGYNKDLKRLSALIEVGRPPADPEQAALRLEVLKKLQSEIATNS